MHRHLRRWDMPRPVVRTIYAIVVMAILVTPATRALAQTPGEENADGVRASIRGGASDRSLDGEASIDTGVLAGFLRVRAGIGVGHWRDPSTTRAKKYPRLIVLAVFVGPRLGGSSWRPYAGAGSAQFAPKGAVLADSIATPLIVGAETSLRRWAFALEIETDVSENLDRRRIAAGDRWSFTPRIGIAIRRGF